MVWGWLFSRFLFLLMDMKSLPIILIALFLTACMQNEEITPTADVLVGSWISESVEIRSLSDEKSISGYKNYLYFGEDHNFFRNYMGGEWELNGRYLTLKIYPDYSEIADWDYKIIDFSKSSLTLQIQLTEGKYCCNFQEFESDEMLLITEKYMLSHEE